MPRTPPRRHSCAPTRRCENTSRNESPNSTCVHGCGPSPSTCVATGPEAGPADLLQSWRRCPILPTRGPVLSRPPGALRLALGATSRDVVLAAPPTSLADAAQKLQAAIRAASGAVAFANALALPLGDQLLIVPSANVATSLAGVPGVDETTVSELQLRGQYPVRVRVNGVEGIGGVNRIELPL